MRLQAYIEGIADVLTTENPVDARAKTYAVDFDGSDDYIDCGTNTALTQLTDWTICAWIKPDNLANSAYTIAGAWTSGLNTGYRLGLSVTAGAASLQVRFAGDGGGVTLAGATLGVNNWTFVAVSVGGIGQTVIRGLMNDTELTRQIANVTRTTRNSFTAGRQFRIAEGMGSSYFNGRIGIVQVFGRALTTDEMRRVRYRRLSVAWGDDDTDGLWDDLVAQWSLERGSGTNAVNDKTPGTHDGTLTFGPTWQSDACYSVTYRPYMFAEASTGQEIDPLGTKTSIQATTLRILDTDLWFTETLANLGMALPGKRVDLLIGFHGLLESEYQRVFTGKISDFSYSGKAYTIRIGDGLLDAKKRVQLGRTIIANTITNAAGQDVQVPVNSYWSEPSVLEAYLKIEDEVLRSSGASAHAGVDATNFSIDCTTRAQFGTSAAAHSAGVAVSEAWIPRATSWDELVLKLLLSGAGWAASSAYDEYVEFTYTNATNLVRRGRGVGMSPSDVAVAEIAAIVSVNGHELVVDDDVDDLKDLIEREILRAFGAFFFVKADGRISIGSHSIPSASVYDLDPTRTHRFEWSVSYEHLCNYLAIECDYNPATGEFDEQFFYSDATAGTKYGLKKREFSFKNIPTTYPSATTLNALDDLIFDRFKEPYRTLTVTCGLYELLLEIGDCVSLTNLNLPNVATGTLGVVEKLWQIIGRRVDFKTGRVELTLADVSGL